MKIEKIIFLDFDGVIITPRTEFLHFDPICMEHLKHIIDETNAFIVISSTWKIGTPFIELKAMFEPFGMFQRVLGTTPNIDGDFVRGREIDTWLNSIHAKRFDIKNFIILDDDSDMEPHMNRLIQTNTQEGLTEDIAKNCIELLNNP